LQGFVGLEVEKEGCRDWFRSEGSSEVLNDQGIYRKILHQRRLSRAWIPCDPVGPTAVLQPMRKTQFGFCPDPLNVSDTAGGISSSRAVDC